MYYARPSVSEWEHPEAYMVLWLMTTHPAAPLVVEFTIALEVFE